MLRLIISPRGRRRLAFAVAMAGLSCSGTDPGPGPSPIPPDQTSRTVSGTVTNTAFSPVADARVAILNTNLSTLTDALGRFDLKGTISGTATVQVTKDGYIPQTREAAWTACLPGVSPCLQSNLGFLLQAVAAPTDITGDYTVVITADPACRDLPAEARTRTYSASISSVRPDNTSLEVRISGPSPLIFLDSVFTAGMAGDNFALELYGSWFHQAFLEKVASDSYVGFNGIATARVPPGASTISAVLDGTVTHCRTSVPLSEPVYGCVPLGSGMSALQPESFVTCQSKNHQMIFSRR